MNINQINFMARTLAMFKVPAMKSANELMALTQNDPLFLIGQTIAQKGIPQQGVPACIACHGPLGEGAAVGPRLAGQNVMYIKNQFKAFAGQRRQTDQSAIMQPVTAGLTGDDIGAVAHYYALVPVRPGVAGWKLHP